MIYFDSAATTLEKPSVVPAASAYAMTHFASPGRGGHQASMRAADAVYRCREVAAELFHLSDPEQVVLTTTATHSLNIAIHSLVQPGGTVLISGYEHNAVTRPLYAIPNINVKVATGLLFDSDGVYQAFARELTAEVDVVICNHVSNVFGFIQPVERIAELCRQRGKPLIVDASQSAGTLPIDVMGWGAAFVAMPGHKGLYGPQGTGLLLCGGGPSRCCTAEQAVFPPTRRCRTFCRTGWRRVPRTCAEPPDCWREWSSSAGRGSGASTPMNADWPAG